MNPMALLCSCSVASALLVSPLQGQRVASGPRMSAPCESRRAVLAGAFAAVLPLAASAASVKQSKDELLAEQKVVEDLDKAINVERSQSRSDSTKLSSLNDKYLEALSKGKKKEAKEIQEQIKGLEAKVEAEDTDLKTLMATEAKEVVKEKSLFAKFKEAKAAELAELNRAQIVAEEVATKDVVGGDNAAVVGKYLK